MRDASGSKFAVVAVTPGILESEYDLGLVTVF